MSEPQLKKQALLIGINKYQNLTELKYARQDAEAVAEALKQNYCFSDDEIILLTDARRGLYLPSTKEVILLHLDDLVKQENDFDLFIFGFWGHGFFRNGQRYLCPQTIMDDAVADFGLSFEELQKQITNIKAKNTCMILDCCQTSEGRGGTDTFSSNEEKEMKSAVRNIAFNKNKIQPEISSNVAILNSCSEGQIAYEWDERQHGIFTAHLLDAMSQRCDSVSSVIDYLRNRVKQTALELGKMQTPFYILKGDIQLPVNPQDATSIFGDVFISYKHNNIDLVEPVLEEFDKRGISYSIDYSVILPGQMYAERIPEAIKQCLALLLFWTDEVNQSSKQIEYEINDALEYDKTIVPYKVGTFQTPPPNLLVHYLSQISFFAAVEQTPEKIVELVNRIEAIISSNPQRRRRHRPGNPFSQTVHISSDQDSQKHKGRAIKSKKIGKSAILFALSVILIAFSVGFFFICNNNKLPDADIPAPECEEPPFVASIIKNDNNPGERVVITVDGIEIAFRWCPAGSFSMGSLVTEDGRKIEEKLHKVTLTKGFWMMETEVTIGMFKAFVADKKYESKGNTPKVLNGRDWEENPAISWLDPGFEQNDNHPVTCVSWGDAVAFCNWLNEKTDMSNKTGKSVQLPTEAQWEYACRAGSNTAFFWGNILSGTNANCNGNQPYGMTRKGDYKGMTMPVGSYSPNQWGLFDMHGNVWEWCSDWSDEYKNGSVTDPWGPPVGKRRILRGGSWYNPPEYCRSACRSSDNPKYRDTRLGFRCIIYSDAIN
ncbi:MAG: SUMF1/EgtB/PvdO family nonheme iron enzyme [Thermoguttaceae bacterium]|nr:SUMF1/EgtB/PvdO family nonheme iron enzyme [Thermoguttaceae bacterium]